jgi:hypothetical protein
LTVTNRDLFFKTKDEFREVNEVGVTTSFILEPLLRLNVETKGNAAAMTSHIRTIEKLIATNLVEPSLPFTQREEGIGKSVAIGKEKK